MSYIADFSPQPRMHYFRDDAPAPKPAMTEDQIAVRMAAMAAAEGHMKRFPSTPTGEADKEEQKKPVSPAMKAVAKALRGNGQLDRHQIAKAAKVSVNSITDIARKLNQAGYRVESTMHQVGRIRIAKFELLSEQADHRAEPQPKRLAHHETLDALRQGPGTAPQIAKRTGRDKSHVSNHVIALKAEGHKISKRKVPNSAGKGGWGYLYTLEEEA